MIDVIKYMIDFKLSIGISDLFSSACNNDGALLGIYYFWWDDTCFSSSSELVVSFLPVATQINPRCFKRRIKSGRGVGAVGK